MLEPTGSCTRSRRLVALAIVEIPVRCTHRVVITNRRLVALEGGKVRFRWKDYACGDRKKTMTLDGSEFLRRFLLHVLPSGFVRIRHYGLLSNRLRQERVATCRALLNKESAPECPLAAPTVEPVVSDTEPARTTVYPRCVKGHMFIVGDLSPIPIDPVSLEQKGESPVLDTS